MPTMRTLFPTNLPSVALTDIIPLMNSTGTTEGVASVSTILGGQLTDIRNITTNGLLYRSSGSVTSLLVGTGLTVAGGFLYATGEPSLGNPALDGYVLSSTTSGTRSWVSAAAAALPAQTGNSGKFLSTNGISAFWHDVPDPLPDQTGNAGKFLSTDGTNAIWDNVPEPLPDQTGNAGKFLSTDGTNAIWDNVPEPLPDQTGNAGKFLSTDGTNASWSNGTGLALPFSATDSFKTTEIDYGEVRLAYDDATTTSHNAILYGGDYFQTPYLSLENLLAGATTVVRSDIITMSRGSYYFQLSGGEYLRLLNTNTLEELILYADRVEIGRSQVLTERQPAIADLPGSATLSDVINKVNEILGMLRTHGLIEP